MKLVRVIAGSTDHSYHGIPVEVSTVELYVDEAFVANEKVMAIMKKNQDEKLKSLCKRMPHWYWAEQHKEGKG